MEQSAASYDILRTIRQLLRRVSEHSRHIGREGGLTVPQLLCLKELGDRDEPATVVQIGEAVQMSPSNVSGVLDRMEKGGLVARVRSTEDRRKVIVTLTDAGRLRAADLPSPLSDSFIERLNALPAHEQQAMAQALDRLVTMMAVPEP